MLSETILADPHDSPQYRVRNSAGNTSIGIPIYHLDVNGQWTINGKPLLISGIDAQELKIMNVLETLVGDEWNEPTFGSLIILRLFEPITAGGDGQVGFKYQIETDTITALATQMADEIVVDISACRVDDMPDDDGVYVTIQYADKIRNAVKILRVALNRNSGFTVLNNGG